VRFLDHEMLEIDNYFLLGFRESIDKHQQLRMYAYLNAASSGDVLSIPVSILKKG
jgi:hypothetical protein